MARLTCGIPASTAITLSDMPPPRVNMVEPGGRTLMSAPMERVRRTVSSIMPWLRPTRQRIRVTGTAISRMLRKVRAGL